MAGLKFSEITDEDRKRLSVLMETEDHDSAAKLGDTEDWLDPHHNDGHPHDAEGLLTDEDKEMLSADKDDQREQSDEEDAAVKEESDKQAEKEDEKSDKVEKAFSDLIEKSRVGTYKDNSENKSKHRVGQRYGQAAQKTEGAQKMGKDDGEAKKAPKGETWDTMSKHKDKSGNYSEERSAKVHKPFLAKVFADAGGAQKNPTLIIMAGGSAAGKGTILNHKVLKDAQDNGMKFGIVDSDEVKKSLPEWNEFVSENSDTAAQRTHNESSDVASWAMKEGIKHKRNLIFDGTMKRTGKYRAFIEEAKKQGYHVQMVAVDTFVDEAVQRAVDRGERTGRLVPENIVRESHVGVSNAFSELKDLFDDWHVYNNDGGGQLIAAKDGVFNEKLFNQFQEKKDTPEGRKEGEKSAYDPEHGTKDLSEGLRDKVKRKEKNERGEQSRGGMVHLSQGEIKEVLDKGTAGFIAGGDKHDELKEELITAGYMIMPATGGMDDDNSIMVMTTDASKGNMVDLGEKYGQKTVLYADHGKTELIYTDKGNKDVQEVTGEGFTMGSGDSSHFTEITLPDGSKSKFSFNVDTSKEKESLNKSFEALGLVNSPPNADSAPERINWKRMAAVESRKNHQGTNKDAVVRKGNMELRYMINKAGDRVPVLVRIGTNANLKS